MKKREAQAVRPERGNDIKKGRFTSKYGKEITRREAIPNPLLHTAATSSELEIQNILDQGADVHHIHNGQTALHRFIDSGNVQGIKKLLLYGASIATKDANKETSLHVAARSNILIATTLITSPQGSVSKVTDTMQNKWLKGNACSYWIMRKFLGVPKEICLMICKLMIPSLKQVIEVVPLSKLQFFLPRYSRQEKKEMLKALVKRHIADLFFQLGVKNDRNQTPRQVALFYSNRMRPDALPIDILNKTLLNQHKAAITANYRQLLGLNR